MDIIKNNDNCRNNKIISDIFNNMPMGVIIISKSDKRVIFANMIAKDILEKSSTDEIYTILYKEKLLFNDVSHGCRKYRIITLNNVKKTIQLYYYNTAKVCIIYLKDITQDCLKIKEGMELESIKKIISVIAHELGNPLAALKISLSLIEEKYEQYSKDKIKDTLRAMTKEVNKMDRFIKGYLSFIMFKKDESLDNIGFMEALENVINLFKETVEEMNIKIINRCVARKNKFIININRVLLEHLLFNIIRNSIEAINEKEKTTQSKYNTNKTKGLIFITCKQLELEESTMLKIEITDTGIGMNEDILKKIFTPFFTTKPTGMGLGLTLAKEIVEHSGGSITAESRIRENTTISILLPIEI